jgi:hypothetical protein
LLVATAAWAAGCATPQPMIEPSFASRVYTPSRIALLPPDVYVVLDQVGENDPVASAALGQSVSAETVRAITQMLRSRGYDVDLSARWDGIVAQDGTVLASRDDLGWMANGILQFANSPDGGGQGTMTTPRFVAPEQAARIGWATQSDALLYLNVKGVTTTPGKRAATILGAVFIVLIVAAIIIASTQRGGGSRSTPTTAGAGGWRGQPVMRGSPPAGGMAGVAGGASPARITPPAGSGVSPPRGRGLPPPRGPASGPVYRGGPNVGIGVGVFVPLNGPTYTHDGTVTHEDDTFAGDELYVAMTLVSAYDGRVLWHVRGNLDLDAEDPNDVRQMVESLLAGLPPRQSGPVSTGAAASSAAPPH